MKLLIPRILSALALCLAFGSATGAESLVQPDQRRGVEQTFLTFPEWFLVHSPAEYAGYVATHPAHDFPFIGHVRQLWSSYGTVIDEQRRQDYPLNIGYHVMICVIAGSTAIEYAIRSLYENTIGRLSWATASGLTAEDRYGAMVAQDYVDFIRKDPWYLYDFTARLKGLWSANPAWGPDLLRKWERRYALTTEYAVKAVYGKLIEVATRTAYDPALMTTQVVVDREPAVLPIGVDVVRKLPDGGAVLNLPRYYNFRIAATRLAERGGKLVDIAGNTSVILVTVWAPVHAAYTAGNSRVLFEQSLITVPGQKRIAIVLPVAELSAFLVHAPQQGLKVEHVYDY